MSTNMGRALVEQQGRMLLRGESIAITGTASSASPISARIISIPFRHSTQPSAAMRAKTGTTATTTHRSAMTTATHVAGILQNQSMSTLMRTARKSRAQATVSIGHRKNTMSTTMRFGNTRSTHAFKRPLTTNTAKNGKGTSIPRRSLSSQNANAIPSILALCFVITGLATRRDKIISSPICCGVCSMS